MWFIIIIAFIVLLSRIKALEEKNLSPKELKELKKKQKKQQEKTAEVLWWIIGIFVFLLIVVLLSLS